MMVFIDSTELANDPYAARRKWERLAEWRNCDFARIIVPQIVTEEAARQFRFSLKEVGRTLNRCLLRMNRLLPSGDWSFQPIPTDGAEDAYRKAITERLAKLCIEQPDHSGIVITTCAGKSTKAAIVTQMIVNYLAQTGDSAAVISTNARDFGSPDKLAAEFQADLEKRGVEPVRVQIYRTLFDFVKAHVKPRMQKRDDVIEAIENGTHPFDSNQLFVDRYDEFFEVLANFIEPWGEFPSHFNTPEFDSPRLAELSTVPEHFQIHSLDMSGNQFTLFVCYSVDGIISCKNKDEGDGYRTRRVSFQIHASVVLDMETGEVDDCEINEDCFYSLWPEEWRVEGPSDETDAA